MRYAKYLNIKQQSGNKFYYAGIFTTLRLFQTVFQEDNRFSTRVSG